MLTRACPYPHDLGAVRTTRALSAAAKVVLVELVELDLAAAPGAGVALSLRFLAGLGVAASEAVARYALAELEAIGIVRATTIPAIPFDVRIVLDYERLHRVVQGPDPGLPPDGNRRGSRATRGIARARSIPIDAGRKGRAA